MFRVCFVKISREIHTKQVLYFVKRVVLRNLEILERVCCLACSTPSRSMTIMLPVLKIESRNSFCVRASKHVGENVFQSHVLIFFLRNTWDFASLATFAKNVSFRETELFCTITCFENPDLTWGRPRREHCPPRTPYQHQNQNIWNNQWRETINQSRTTLRIK